MNDSCRRNWRYCFVDHPKYYDKALNSAATIVLINKNVACPEGKALLISEDPFRDFNKLTNYFKPFQFSNVSIATSASIGEGTVMQYIYWKSCGDW
jgi:UDP-3-O-[3-hydroxymyristoyl] glucosamine N-acyltransferase